MLLTKATGSLCAADVQRTSDGLLVLYTFNEGTGKTIQDRSGVGSPFNLKIEKPAAIQWRDGSLIVRSSTLIRSSGPARKLIDAIAKTGALSIEAWIKPGNDKQDGPARIVTLSKNTSLRNFTLGQEASRYDVRLRTTSTSSNGIPSTGTPRKSAQGTLTHIIMTRDSRGKLTIFIDSGKRASKRVTGKLSNWAKDYRLALANEVTGDRPWLGELYLVAIYNRALNQNEVLQNYKAGPEAGRDPQEARRLAAKRAAEKAGHFFATRVAPLLANRCLECHDTAIKKGGLDLSRKRAALAGGDQRSVIIPGNSAKSLLWKHVSAGNMPPRGEPLSLTEKQLLKKWIDDGAIWSVDLIDPSVHIGRSNSNEVWIQRLTIDEYIETVRSTVGVDIARDARKLLPPDIRADGFSNTAYNLNIDLKHIEAYARLARSIVKRMDVGRFAGRFSNSRSLNTDATARKFVAAAGRWLFRGPLEDREVTNFSGMLTAVASAGGSYEQGVALMLEAMLQSPRFLYRIERQHGDGAQRRVGEYELASRMSYIIWGGPPDSVLYKAAQTGKLSDREACRLQIKRMLKDGRAVTRSQNFLSDWLHLERLNNLQPNTKRYPDWQPTLGNDMRIETLAFFEEIAWKSNRPLSDLFNAQFTYATPRLARHYGLTPKGEGLQRYDLSGIPSRGGLLTHGSILTIGGDDASMVTRGLFVFKDILRGVIGAPPPGVDTAPVPAKPGLSLRMIAKQRIENVACAACHKKFEPLAFGLEQFDGLGGYHNTDEFGNRLRADGEILFPGNARPVKYKTSAELMDILAKSDRVQQTLTWKLTQYALGRPLGSADVVEVQRIYKAAKEGGGTYSALITAIILSDLVQKTRTQK